VWNRDIFMEALNQSQRAMQYAPRRLMMDKDFVLDAVANDWHSFEYIAPKLKADRDVVLCAVKQAAEALDLAEQGVRSDPDVVKVMICANFESIGSAPRADCDCEQAALENNGRNACKSLVQDRDVVLEAVTQNWENIKVYSFIPQQQEPFSDILLLITSIKTFPYHLRLSGTLHIKQRY
jgi:hypothetical protein